MSSSAIDTQLLRVVCAQTNFRVKVRLHPKLNNDTHSNNNNKTTTTGQATTAVTSTAVGIGVVYDGQEEVTHLLESGSVIEVYTEQVDGFYKLIDNQVYYYVYMLLKHI